MRENVRSVPLSSYEGDDLRFDPVRKSARVRFHIL